MGFRFGATSTFGVGNTFGGPITPGKGVPANLPYILTFVADDGIEYILTFDDADGVEHIAVGAL